MEAAPSGLVWITVIGLIAFAAAVEIAITAIGVIAFIAVCEIAISFARRNPRFLARLYLLGDLDKLGGGGDQAEPDPDAPKPRNETERSRRRRRLFLRR